MKHARDNSTTQKFSPALLGQKWLGLQTASKVAIILYSIVGAFTAVIGARVVRTEWFYKGNYEENYFPGLQPIDALLFVALLVAVFAVTCAVLLLYKFLLERIPLREKPVRPLLVFLVSWIVIFVCWLPYFFTNYPGVIMADSIVIIKQALGINPLTTHHPLAYTGLIWLCLTIGEAIFGGYVEGIAIYTIVQMLFMSAAFAYMLSWMARRRIPLPALLVILVALSLLSVFSLHAVCFWKDGIYACFMLLLALRLFDGIAEPERLGQPLFLERLALLGLAVCLARTNGIFAMVLVWPCLVVLSKGNRAKVALAAVASLASFALIMNGATLALGAKSDPVESYGIPLQQAAAVVVFEGEMNEEEREFMNTLLPLEDYKPEYLPCSVDGIKWADNFDKQYFADHQKEFLQVWASMLPKNLGIYANAYIMESYEYWTFGDTRRNLHVNYVNDKYDAPDLGIVETNLIDQWFGEGASEIFPFRFTTLGEGAVSWIVLFAGLMLFVARREKWAVRPPQVAYRAAAEGERGELVVLKEAFEPFNRPWWLVILPAFASWLTVLISSPFAALPRYVLPSIFLLPVIILLPWLVKSCEDRQKFTFSIDEGGAPR